MLNIYKMHDGRGFNMLKGFKAVTAMLTGMVTLFSTCIGVLPVQATESVIAFPGAVGGGKYATGGRGGEVVHVTNLNDSGEGSFREAVSKSNRIVVFDVSGTIELESNVVVQSNITIAGQTAPGGSGITLKNYKLGLGGTNVICRYVSSRPGPYKATSSGNDALGGAGGSNSIIDHCSIGWASDEQWGLYSKNDNYTCQYTVIGPANSWGGHAKGVHGFGIMLGRSNVSYDHNLIIHNVSRNFRGKVPDQNAADFTNNIIYDWGYQTTYGTIGHINYVNNTLKAGNSTTSGYHYAQVSDNENFKLYLSGNRILNKDNTVRNSTDDNWSAITYGGEKNKDTTISDTPFSITTNGENVSTVANAESAEVSYENVINFAGNGISPTQRTAIDQQCAEETKNGTGSCSGTAAYDSSVSDLDKYSIQCGVTYEYPEAILTKTITDSDNDGMPDSWETARGLNPNDASDTNGDYCGQGYTNIEYYINDLTVNSFPEGVVTLSPTTNGETENPDIPDAPTVEYATLEQNSVYMIKNKNSNLYMEVEGAGTADGTNVQQWGANETPSLHNSWRVVASNKENCYYLYSMIGDGASYCLNLANESTENGANIELMSKNYKDAQQFMFIKNEDGSYKISPRLADGKSFIEVDDALTTSGANVQLWESNGATCQDWILEKIEYTGVKMDTSKIYTIKNDASLENVTLSEAGNGYYLIKQNDLYLTVSGGVSASGTAVLFAEEDKTSAQLFKFIKNPNGSHSLLTKASKDKCALSSNGVELVQNICSSELNQQWTVEIIGDITVETVKGDLNADGSVNIIDILMLKKHLVSVTSINDISIADMNSDGKINSFDFVILKNSVL